MEAIKYYDDDCVMPVYKQTASIRRKCFVLYTTQVAERKEQEKNSCK